jgi:short-subunit dehydrogenase
MSQRRPIAWVTGAGKGIGRAVAARLAQDNWQVAVSARTVSDLEALSNQCADGAVRAFPLDITDPAAAARTVSEIEDTLGPIDMVFLNAGTHETDSALEFAAASVRRLVEVNFMGTMHCLEPILSRFVDRGRGHVAVVASLAGYKGLPKAAGYGASKAALINLCEALKPELDAAGVKLTLINPGFIKTPLTDRNTFEMPFLMPVDQAADAIVNGLKGNAFEVSMPWRFALIMKVMRWLPDRLYFAVMRRMISR